jgi:histidine ammonia-lyase
VLRVREQIERMRLLTAIELIVAAQAVDLALSGQLASLGVGTRAAHSAVRECVEMLQEDRPIGPDVERLSAELLDGGQLLERVGAAAGAPS